MEALNKSMSIEDIIKEYDKCKFSEEIGKFLESKDITFEVIDGIVCVKSKPLEHDFAKKFITSLIDKELDKKGLDCDSFIELRMLRGVNYGNDFLIPDVSVLNISEGNYGSNGMFLGIPKLVIEIMSSNRNDDINKKRLLYGEMGIPEYWIVDLDTSTITQLILKNGSYGKKGTFHMEGNIKHHLCGLKLNLEDIFKLINDKLTKLNKTK